MIAKYIQKQRILSVGVSVATAIPSLKKQENSLHVCHAQQTTFDGLIDTYSSGGEISYNLIRISSLFLYISELTHMHNGRHCSHNK